MCAVQIFADWITDYHRMPIITASKTQPVYDVIVVGSGAGGGQAAYTFTMAGARVLMLEAGRNYDPVKETPMFQTNATAPLRGVATKDKPWGFYDSTIDGGWTVPGEPYTQASDDEAQRFDWWRARMLGGRTNHWGRISLRFGPDDSPWYGVAFSTTDQALDVAWRALQVTGAVLGAWHGYKRNESVAWAAVWGLWPLWALALLVLAWASLLPFFQLPSVEAARTISLANFDAIPWDLVLAGLKNTVLLMILTPTVTLAPIRAIGSQPRVAHEAVVAQVVVVVGDEDVEHHAREQLLGIGLHRHGMNVAADGSAQVRIGLVRRFELAAGHRVRRLQHLPRELPGGAEPRAPSVRHTRQDQLAGAAVGVAQRGNLRRSAGIGRGGNRPIEGAGGNLIQASQTEAARPYF